jgi:hypothetical protein
MEGKVSMRINVAVLLLAASMATGVAGVGDAQTAAASQAAQSPSPDWEMTIRMDKDFVKAGAEIKLWVDLRNISDRPIAVTEEIKNPRVVELRYRACVRAESGAMVPETKWGRRVRTGKDDPGEFTVQVGSIYQRYIQPGQTRTDAISLSGQYDLSQPGRYAVQVEIPDEKGSILFKSNTLTFTVAR